MSRHVARALIPLAALLGACAPPGGRGFSAVDVPAPVIEVSGSNGANQGSIRDDAMAFAGSADSDGEAIPMPTDVTRAVEARIAVLKTRGGDCSRYGTVLEHSYRAGRITIRPYMWRVGRNLASGEAKPNGDMMLAREIDSLNVGVRTVTDVVFSMEHEAVHIAFDLASGNEFTEEHANQLVRACTGSGVSISGRDG